jgi:hypothetical protein
MENTVPSVYDFVEVESVRKKLEKSVSEQNTALKKKDQKLTESSTQSISVNHKSLEVAYSELTKKSSNKLSEWLSSVVASHNDFYKQSSSMFTNLKLTLDDTFLKMQRTQRYHFFDFFFRFSANFYFTFFSLIFDFYGNLVVS